MDSLTMVMKGMNQQKETMKIIWSNYRENNPSINYTSEIYSTVYGIVRKWHKSWKLRGSAVLINDLI